MSTIQRGAIVESSGNQLYRYRVLASGPKRSKIVPHGAPIYGPEYWVPTSILRLIASNMRRSVSR